MSALLASPWVVVPIVAALVFIIVYLNVNRTIEFLKRRSLGQREEVIRLLELMFVDVEESRVTQIMLLISFGFGGLIFIALWPNILPGAVLGAAVTVIGWSIPKNVVHSLWSRRCDRFVEQMVDGMTIMANGVKAGLSVQQSMERVVENMPNPMSQEFGLVLSQMRLGRSLEEALNDLGMRIPKPDVQMFVTAVNILQETGGNLAETFQTIVYTVRERQKVEKKIEALTAQGMMQGIIITLVPFFLLVVFLVIDPAYVMPMFTTVVGVIALLIMLTLQVIGGVMIRKIVKINV